MKKKLIIGVALLCMSFSTFAIDFSVGVTAGGLGPSFIRGEEYKLAKESDVKVTNDPSLVFAPAVSVNAVLEFVPFLGLEAGLGFGTAKAGLKYTSDSETLKVYSEFTELMIPIMLRLQLPVANFNIYAGVGANLNIVLSGKAVSSNSDGKETIKLEKGYYNGFVVDLVFALGAEYAIAQKHFVGLRAQYNLGLMDRVGYGYEGAEKPSKAAVLSDALAFSLTYRYKF
ncbi:MAG: outer membrane beta-barrel protein [Treponemataceae bacterium]